MNEFLYFLNVCIISGTLTHSGTVAVDCGGQQTFTCDVTGITIIMVSHKVQNLVNARA